MGVSVRSATDVPIDGTVKLVKAVLPGELLLSVNSSANGVNVPVASPKGTMTVPEAQQLWLPVVNSWPYH